MQERYVFTPWSILGAAIGGVAGCIAGFIAGKIVWIIAGILLWDSSRGEKIGDFAFWIVIVVFVVWGFWVPIVVYSEEIIAKREARVEEARRIERAAQEERAAEASRAAAAAQRKIEQQKKEEKQRRYEAMWSQQLDEFRSSPVDRLQFEYHKRQLSIQSTQTKISRLSRERHELEEEEDRRLRNSSDDWGYNPRIFSIVDEIFACEEEVTVAEVEMIAIQGIIDSKWR